jgi:hypothetical protein
MPYVFFPRFPTQINKAKTRIHLAVEPSGVRQEQG